MRVGRIEDLVCEYLQAQSTASAHSLGDAQCVMLGALMNTIQLDHSQMLIN